MDTRSSAIRIVAAFFLVMIFPSVGFSDTVHIYTGDFNLPIPAGPGDTKGWMADAVINVPGHLVISDLDIGINVAHTSAFDLQIFLQSPVGTVICLSMFDPYDEFFIGANYTDTIFDDESPVFIKDGDAPFTGRFRPVDELSKFDGQDAFGSWHLQIYDAFYADTGTLKSFGITISAPEPAAFFPLALGVLFCKSRTTSHKRRV